VLDNQKFWIIKACSFIYRSLLDYSDRIPKENTIIEQSSLTKILVNQWLDNQETTVLKSFAISLSSQSFFDHRYIFFGFLQGRTFFTAGFD